MSEQTKRKHSSDLYAADVMPGKIGGKGSKFTIRQMIKSIRKHNKEKPTRHAWKARLIPPRTSLLPVSKERSTCR